jgi:Tfp pilus assembly protein PilW
MVFFGCDANMSPVRGGRDRASMPFRARRGSSLVEMLVAVVVLMFVLMAMASMFLLSQTVTYTKEDETATAIALRFIEQQEGRPFEDFADATKFPDTEDFGKYSATASVVSGDDYSAKVRVAVEWQASVGAGRKNVTLERVISAGGHKNVGGL